MAIAQKLAGYTLGKADLLRRAMGKKKKRGARREYVRLLRGHAGQRLLSEAAIKTLWDILRPVLRLRVQQGAHRRLRRWSPTGPPTSRPTTRPSTWPRCSPASATTRTSRRSTSTSAGAWASRCCRPTSTSRSANFTAGRHRHPLRPGRDPQRRRQRRRRRSSRRARSKGRFTSFKDFLRKVPAVVCNKRTIESLIKAGAFDALRHTRAGRWCEVHEDYVDAFVDIKRKEAIGQDSLFGGFGDDATAASRSTSRCCRRSRTSSGTRRRCSRSSARCSASTSPTTRCSASSTCWPSTPTPRSPR